MKLTYLILVLFVFYGSIRTNPVLKDVVSWVEEFEPEEKIREKRKSGLLDQLEEEGIGVKKSSGDDEVDREAAKDEEIIKVELPPAVEDELSEFENTRSKKQVHDNVCIQDMSNGGKTSCGRVISARGPSAKMLLRGDPGMIQSGQVLDPKPEKYSSMQSRTFDSLFPLTSLTSSVAYAVPTTSFSSADAITHTLPAIATAPALPVAPVASVAPVAPIAPIAHIEPLSLLSHTIPIHPMHTMFTHRPLMNVNLQRMELPKIQEVIYTPAEVKQPTYEVKPIVTRPISSTPILYSSRYGSVNTGYDGPMICHPLGDERASQQVIQIRPEVHVIESGHKNNNSNAEEFKSSTSDMSEDDEKKVRDHLRQVNEIREEITQLNKAAQRIVDQQERLAEMQQRHLWRSSDKADYTKYSDPRIYMLPPTYTRANAISYPNGMDDIEFFLNMLKTGKNLGALSSTFQPAIVSALDATRLVLGGDTNSQSNNSQPKVTKENSESGNVQTTSTKRKSE